jgi:glycine hydroxymethyltransferase
MTMNTREITTTPQHALARRDWVPEACEARVQALASAFATAVPRANAARLESLVAAHHADHDARCINLNPATNAMNPRAEALLARGLGVRPSLGYPGDKYEMGLEQAEQIEVLCAELAAEVFHGNAAEVRVPSGAMANLYAYMACAKPGDAVIAPPASVGGHVTHHANGAAGLFGVVTHAPAVNVANYTIDLDDLRRLAHRVKPKLITLGGSLNLFHHPVREARAIADEVGAVLLFDAAHLSGPIAGGQWPNPLDEGAHLMSMSTYKSLGGPPGGLIVCKEPAITKRLDAIAYPGLTANFDLGRVAALALTLIDWQVHGQAYAQAMHDTAHALGTALVNEGLPVFARERGITRSHQLAVEAAHWGGGHAAAKRLREAGLLASGIGLPIAELADDMNGLRLGTPEIVRLGLGPAEMPVLGRWVADALLGRRAMAAVAEDVAALRGQMTGVRYVG